MAIARELENRIREGWSSAAELAIVYLGLGEDEEALDKLEAALAKPPFTRNYYFSFLKVDPIWDPLRSDPRFQDLLRRINFPE